ncbi:alpha-ketoglutarate-dependent dioxygenase AlkB [Streptomyces sp. GS7]|uniref:alpha-ketoglutarate-dependent dioxygenase AlkB n=1 Tax=Streptomyces sp. GS7 TaxID=2692234 RepID=UPI0019152E7B|nr:alpha-ketoglutarate-dependent dioxygenase AlkB [Streptomyces sp. GS7]
MLHENGALFGRPSIVVAPGAILIPGWLSQEVQQELVTCSRKWAMGPAGMRRPRMPDGSWMHMQSVCLGWHWKPYQYSRIADDVDGERVRPMPQRIKSLARAAVQDAAQLDPTVSHNPDEFSPDAAIINFYDDDDRLGMHQDRAEDNSAPVVTLSLGDSCIFRFGNPVGRTKPWKDLVLQSGDLFVFGGPSRLAFHGVRRTLPGTSPAGLDIRRGRVSVTVRETGISDR